MSNFSPLLLVPRGSGRRGQSRAAQGSRTPFASPDGEQQRRAGACQARLIAGLPSPWEVCDAKGLIEVLAVGPV